MCGHGTIGLVTALAHMGRIKPGEHRIETPVRVVAVTLHDDARKSGRGQECPHYAKRSGDSKS
jgi:4-hydroxyproline epimerase